MRRITWWILSTLSAIVLLFSYPTSTSAKARTSIVATSPLVSGSSNPTTAPSSGSTDSSSSSGSASSGSTGSGSGTYTGDAVMTRWGTVQVQITVADGKITKADVVQIPWDNPRDQQINTVAVPMLNGEVVSAQSAQIDMVSGATVTSGGYVQSLQSAIDQAHLS